MDPWLKIDAARAYAGGVSRRTLYAAVAAGKLRAARIGHGRNLLFCHAWLDEWLERSAQDRVPTEGQARAEAAGAQR